MAIVRHRPGEAKTLYDFSLVANADGDAKRVVFLSERDFSIILNATELADRLRHRVFYETVGEFYSTVSDADFALFTTYINDLRVNLGGFLMSNELLERIAVALEGLNTSAATRVTWDEFIQDLENTLGLTHWFVVLTKGVFDLIPQVRLKLDFTPLALSAWEYFTWKAPVLALLGTMSAALTTSAAASVAEKGISVYRAALATISTILDLGGRWKDFFFGDWSVYDDLLKPLLDAYFPDSEGGTGGTDPDADPDLRALTGFGTSLQNTLTNNLNISCGHGSGCGCGGGLAAPSTGSIVDSDALPPEADPEQANPPSGFETWEAYFSNKCAAANFIVDATAAIFRVIGSANAEVTSGISGAAFGAVLVTLFNTALAAFATSTGYSSAAAAIILGGAGLATAPIWVQGAIVVAIAGIVASVGIGVLSLFASVGDEFLANREELVCLLVNADQPATAAEALEQAWADAILSLVIEEPYDAIEATIRTVLGEVIGLLISNNLVNLLFERSDLVDNYTAPNNCAECIKPCFEFTSSLEGWTKDAPIWGNYNLTHGPFGYLVMTVSQVESGSFRGSASSAEITGYTIKDGDVLGICVGSRAFAFDNRITLILDGSPVEFDGFLGGAETGLGHDLSIHEGKVVSGMSFEAWWASAAIGQQIRLNQIGIDCPQCPES